MIEERVSNPAVRILLVDDHLVMREGTRRILEEQEDFQVVAETDDGTMAIALAWALKPDLVLMDIKIKGKNGIEATRAIKDASPETQVVALTGYDLDQYVRAMIRAGAVGYVLKSASGKEVVDAVRTASRGNLVFSAEIAQKIAYGSFGKDGSSSTNTSPLSLLSDRELGILSLIAGGKRNAQIAEELKIQPKTVEYHLTSIYAKLGVNTRGEAMRLASELGIATDLIP